PLARIARNETDLVPIFGSLEGNAGFDGRDEVADGLEFFHSMTMLKNEGFFNSNPASESLANFAGSW
ncbi:hypothetical protein EBZ37_12030, partial [bacterium]|nr:hypothetical protein [bacterium]